MPQEGGEVSCHDMIDASSHLMINPTRRTGLSFGISDPGSRPSQNGVSGKGYERSIDTWGTTTVEGLLPSTGTRRRVLLRHR